MKKFTILSRVFMFVIFTATFSVLLPAQLSHAHNKVVVIPLGDSDGVYAKISGTWFGTITSPGFTYTTLWTIAEDADVGTVAASAAYNSDSFNCGTVQTRISESGNDYSFTENPISGTPCSSPTIVLTYNPNNDTITYSIVEFVNDTGTLSRVALAP